MGTICGKNPNDKSDGNDKIENKKADPSPEDIPSKKIKDQPKFQIEVDHPNEINNSVSDNNDPKNVDNIILNAEQKNEYNKDEKKIDGEEKKVTCEEEPKIVDDLKPKKFDNLDRSSSSLIVTEDSTISCSAYNTGVYGFNPAEIYHEKTKVFLSHMKALNSSEIFVDINESFNTSPKKIDETNDIQQDSINPNKDKGKNEWYTPEPEIQDTNCKEELTLPILNKVRESILKGNSNMENLIKDINQISNSEERKIIIGNEN